MVDTIDKAHPDWERYMTVWREEKKPARLVLGSRTYRVVQGMEGDMQFRPESKEEQHDHMTSSSM